MPQSQSAAEVLSYLNANLVAIRPETHLILWGLGLLIIDRLILHKWWNGIFALVAIAFASIELWQTSAHGETYFFETVIVDAYSVYFKAIFLISAAISIAISLKYLDVEDEQHGEFYALILFSTAGMMFMAAAVDLITMFVGLELMSLCIYILVGFLRSNRKSNEASLKYFLLGSFSTGILLYGMSILYGISGSTNLDKIALAVAGMPPDSPILYLATIALLAGLCFKVAAVPFHMWAPDAYEGAPTSVTAFMSVAVKAAGFAIFFRLFFVAIRDARAQYLPLLALVCIATMTFGNITAISQNNVKRLLAYSSISHAGFILLGLIAGTNFGVYASAFYLFIYMFMNLGAFTVLILLCRRHIPGDTIDDLNGLFFKSPAVAVIMLLFLLSLSGIPPLAGFYAKYFVFAAVVDAYISTGSNLMLALSIIAVLNVAISLYYYVRLVVAMFFKESTEPAELSMSPGLALALVVTTALTVGIGLYPNPFIELAQRVSFPIV